MKELMDKLDMTEEYLGILAFKNTIPQDGSIPCDQASVFQTKCWLISCDLTRLTTIAEVHAGKTKRLKEDTLNDKKSASEATSEAGREREAKCNEEYRAVAYAYVTAEALLNNLLSLKKFFENGVYVMRSRQDKEAKDWQATPTTEV